MVFEGVFIIFHDFLLVSMGFSWWFHGFSWWFHGGFMVFGWFSCFSLWFHGFHGFWLVSMVWLVETTTKLYPGPMIQSRPCRPKAGFGLVIKKFCCKKNDKYEV